MASKSFKRAPIYSSYALISLILASLSWILCLLYIVDDVAPIIFSFCPCGGRILPIYAWGMCICSEANAALWALTWLPASLSVASCLFFFILSLTQGKFCVYFLG